LFGESRYGDRISFSADIATKPTNTTNATNEPTTTISTSTAATTQITATTTTEQQRSIKFKQGGEKIQKTNETDIVEIDDALTIFCNSRFNYETCL
ncbi:hypothetical protein PPL_11531, partial [Heterostelium album PN500]